VSIPNRYAGKCWYCGSKVAEMAGTYDPEKRCARHAEGECKTTTKTYRESQSQERMAMFKGERAALFEQAGYTVVTHYRIEAPDEITGNGIRALVGGYASGAVMPHGVRLYRDTLASRFETAAVEVPIPRAAGGDFFADGLESVRMLIALLNEFAMMQLDKEAGQP
jgi:hypothetical protein